jgi:hypothetical protein
MSESTVTFRSYGLLGIAYECSELNDIDRSGCWYGDHAPSGREELSGPAAASRWDPAQVVDGGGTG